jgi:dTMP kinase
MRGKIIVIEGTDCSGKETQSKLLEKKLDKCVRFSFPRYDSPTGKIVGGPYLGKEEISKSYFTEGAVNVSPYIASLYYAADRKYNMDEINKYLDDGYTVILDRYTTSNLAHQGSKFKTKEERFNMYQWIDKLEYWLLGLPKPDLTIFLHVPLEVTLELLKKRTSLDEHEKDSAYLKRSEDAYLELAGLYNWSKIECVKDNKLRSIEEINEEILKIIKEDI